MTKKVLILLGIVIVAVAIVVTLSSNKKPTPSTTNSGTAVNNAVLTTKTSSTLGQYLVGASGKALYTYNKDVSGVSNCSGSCLAAWPAYIDSGSTTNLPSGVGTIKRTDTGQNQYAYNGLPLYYFASDSVGQVTGNGVDSFSLAKPAASTQSTAPPTTQSNTSSAASNPYSY